MTKRNRRHFGSVFARPGRPGYYIRVRHLGIERIRHSGPSKTVANSQLARIQTALGLGMPVDQALEQVFGAPARECPTFREIAERYRDHAATIKRASTVREDGNRIDQIVKATWTRRRIAEIRPAEVARWLDQLRKTRRRGTGVLSPATRNRFRSLISVIFNYGIELGFLNENPVAGVKRFDERGRERGEYLTPDELRALLGECDPALRLLIIAAVSTGLRRGSLLQLKWRDIDLDRGTVTVHASMAKGKRPITLPLPHALVESLRQERGEMKVRQMYGDDRVFRGPKGGPWNPNSLHRQFRKAVDGCAAIPREKRRMIVFHSLRHTFGSLLTQGGVHQRVVQQAMSHSVPELTARYSHLDVDSLTQVAEYFNRLLSPPSPPSPPESIREGYQGGYQASSGGQSNEEGVTPKSA